MARKSFSSGGVKCLCKAYVAYICGATSDVIEQYVNGDTKEINQTTYFQPKNELKKDETGEFSKESFNDLFINHPVLIGIFKRISSSEGITVGGMKSLNSITEIINRNILHAKEGTIAKDSKHLNILNGDSEAFKKAVYQYKVAHVYEKDLSNYISPKELFQTIFEVNNLAKKDFDSNQSYAKVEQALTTNFSSIKCSPLTTLSNLATQIKMALNIGGKGQGGGA